MITEGSWFQAIIVVVGKGIYRRRVMLILEYISTHGTPEWCAVRMSARESKGPLPAYEQLYIIHRRVLALRVARVVRAWDTLIMLTLRCAEGREFDPRPGQYSRMSFSSDQVGPNWHGFPLSEYDSPLTHH